MSTKKNNHSELDDTKESFNDSGFLDSNAETPVSSKKEKVSRFNKGEFNCPYCDASDSTRIELSIHVNEKHEENQEDDDFLRNVSYALKESKINYDEPNHKNLEKTILEEPDKPKDCPEVNHIQTLQLKVENVTKENDKLRTEKAVFEKMISEIMEDLVPVANTSHLVLEKIQNLELKVKNLTRENKQLRVEKAGFEKKINEILEDLVPVANTSPILEKALRCKLVHPIQKGHQFW